MKYRENCHLSVENLKAINDFRDRYNAKRVQPEQASRNKFILNGEKYNGVFLKF